MSRRTRFLRIAGAVLGVLAFVAWFGFSTFFFSPLEGSLDVPVAALVDRKVDFYVAKARLAEDFDGFPRLAVLDELETVPAWRTFAESPEGRDLAARLDLETLLTRLAEAADGLPLGLDPLGIFGGRELALAGRFRGSDLTQAEWALYGRMNWAGKLALSALSHPALAQAAVAGLETSEADGVVTLTGAGLARPLYAARVLDVGVITTSPDLAQKALELHRTSYEDSLFLKAEYDDYVRRAERRPERDEIEFFVDTRAYFEGLPRAPVWPDPKSIEFLPSFLGKLFQVGAMNELVGLLAPGWGTSLDAHASLSAELITPLQRKLYSARSVDRKALEREIVRRIPADASLAVYLQADIGDLARAVLDSLEPALRDQIEEQFQATRVYSSLEEVVDDLDAGLRDGILLVVRPNDYQVLEGDPPNDGEPVPVIGLVGWVANEKPLIKLREAIGLNGHLFGLRGGKPGQSGYYSYRVAGYDVREFWSPLVTGTGVIAAGIVDDALYVTNHARYIGDLRKTYTVGPPDFPRLDQRNDFQILLGTSLAQANVFVWLNPSTLTPELRKRARRAAEESIVIDWRTERAKAENQALAELYPGMRRDEVTPEIQAELDRIVDPRLEELKQRIYAEQVPVVMAERERRLQYLEAASGVLGMIALEPSRIDLALRVLWRRP